MNTYTIHGLPDLPEGYGPELEYGIPTRDSVVLNTLPGNRSGWTLPATYNYGLYAPKTKPWYPDEWYDPLTGDLLPDVYEHTPGEWPKCRPKDEVDYLHRGERMDKCFCEDPREAINLEWDDEHIVAYRIVKRVKV